MFIMVFHVRVKSWQKKMDIFVGYLGNQKCEEIVGHEGEGGYPSACRLNSRRRAVRGQGRNVRVILQVPPFLYSRLLKKFSRLSPF